MCCFSQPVKVVANTRIFARGMGGGKQALVYAMDLDADADLAMVLPLPVPPACGEDAVRFVDLSGYADFLADMAAAFPPRFEPMSRSLSARAAPQAAPLKVHDVGDFEASFVPHASEFWRLDARFRLPEGALDALPQYADWGFAVFKLREPPKRLFGLLRRTRRTYHPMAFVFPRRDPTALFFPTLHIHDGAVRETAIFDHELFAQLEEGGRPPLDSDWEASEGPLGQWVDVKRAQGLATAHQKGWRRFMKGGFPNEDTWLAPTVFTM
ncbi:MAG: hypothetical protein H6739_09000 [Alphaproteobacteria bacterium]|nr:hypothetical protein [Alphaproteobacteria bacterium]